MVVTNNAKADDGNTTNSSVTTNLVESTSTPSSQATTAASEATSSAVNSTATSSAASASAPGSTANSTATTTLPVNNLVNDNGQASTAEILPSLVKDLPAGPSARSVDEATINYVDALTNDVVSTDTAPAGADGNYSYTATAPTGYILVNRANTHYTGSAAGDPTVNIPVLKTEKRHYNVIEVMPDGTNKTLLSLDATIVQRKDAAGNLAWGAFDRDESGTVVSGRYQYQNDLVSDSEPSGNNNQGHAYVDTNAADKTWFTINPDVISGHTLQVETPSGFTSYSDGVGFAQSGNHFSFDLFGGDDSYNSILPDANFYLYYAPIHITYQFVDDDNHGAVVGSPVTVSGNSNTTVNTGLTIPTHYELTSGTLPTSVVLGLHDQSLQIHLVHQHKQITRQLTVKYINAQTGQSMGNLAPDAKLDVYYSKDLVTGDVTWDPSQGDSSTPGYRVISGNWGHNTENGGNGGVWAPGLSTNSSTILSVEVPNVSGFNAETHGDWENGVSNPVIYANEYTWPGWATDGTTTDQTYTDHAPFYEARPVHTIYYVPTSDVKRTISFVKPDGSQIAPSVTQTSTSTWEGTWQSGSDQWKFNHWSGVKFPEYTPLPSVLGYTADVSSVPSETTSASINSAGPNQGTDVTVIYTPNPQTNTIKFVDDDNGGAQVGPAQTINGVTDQTISLNLSIPAFYNLAPGQSLPTSYTFGATNAPIEIHLVHQTTPVDPSTPGDTKTVKRTITAELPTGNQDLSQIITLHRTGNRDAITGNITWNPWEPGSFAAVNAPVVPGYTPSISVVPAVASVPGDYRDPHVIITYSANPELNTIKFVDDDNHEAQVGPTQTIAGTTGQTINLYLSVPANYQLAPGQSLPTSYTFGATNSPIVIHLVHQQQALANDTKTIKRTITAYLPNGTTQDLSQTITLSRSVTKDLVTGQITYGNWTTGSFASVNAPEVPGYTPNVSVVPAVDDVSTDYVDPHIVITYAANKSVTPNQPVTPGQPSQPNTSTQHQQGNNNNSETNASLHGQAGESASSTQGNKLPQTGNHGSNLAVIGLLGISLVSMLGLDLHKRKQLDN